MQKILVVCGPTATGKTKLALRLAKKFNAEIVSADSRQVYKEMDIGTGKDLPPNAKFQTRLPGGKVLNTKLGGFYIVDGIRVWGYDLVNFKESFSVYSFVTTAQKIIRDIQRRGKLVIVVGGAGLYIKGVVDGIASAGISRNTTLRRKLEAKSIDEIFSLLKSTDQSRASLFNASDRKNKRRLIRALEIAQNRKSRKIKSGLIGLGKNNDTLFLGLSAGREVLYDNIRKRVNARIKDGFENEIKKLLKKGFLSSPQAVNTLGYKEWLNSSFGGESKLKFVNSWALAEQKYIKKQITWFKKDRRINWFSIENMSFEKEIEKMVQKWYHSEDETGGPKSRAFV